MKTIGEVMTAHAHTIGAEQTLEHAKHVMYEFGIRHLAVLSAGNLVGVLSDRDIKLCYAVDGEKAKNFKVSDACSSEPYSAEVETPLSDVCANMAKRGIGCCIVMKGAKVAGIFTVTDACRVLSELSES